MKKQNFGIPAMILCISAYALAASGLWTVVALTILVFAFNFEPKVRKTALQATAINLIFLSVNMLFTLLYQFIGSDGAYTSITNIFSDTYSHVSVFNKIIYLFDNFVEAAEIIVFVILIVCIIIKNDIILQPVTKAVDGFVPPQPNQYQQPMQPHMQQPMQQSMQQPMQQPMQPHMQPPVQPQPMNQPGNQPSAYVPMPNSFPQAAPQPNQFGQQPNSFQQPQNPNQPR